MLGDRDEVLRLSARAFDGVLTGITVLGPCLEAAADALAAEAPAAAAVLHGYVDAYSPHLMHRQPHTSFRRRAVTAIDVRLDADHVVELRSRGAGMTQDEVSTFAGEAIARLLDDVPRRQAP